MYEFLSRTVEVESVVEPQGATKRGPRKQLLATLLYPANKFSEFISEKKVPRSKSVIVNMNPLYDSFYELMFSFTAFWIIATSIMTFVCAYSFRNSFLSLIILTFDISFFMFQYLKGCVRYIFTSLFCMSKWEDLWNKETCFVFHFENSFRSWDNQILSFQIFKCHDVIKCLSMKRETDFIE